MKAKLRSFDDRDYKLIIFGLVQHLVFESKKQVEKIVWAGKMQGEKNTKERIFLISIRRPLYISNTLLVKTH